MRAAWFVLVLAIAAAACSADPAESVADQGRAAWVDLGIEDYRIVFVVQNLNGMGGSPGDGTYDVIVEGGEVTQCRVEPLFGGSEDDCAVTMRDPVEKLFRYLDEFDPLYTTVSFDSEFHFPDQIEYDVPNLADEEYWISVREFETLG